MMMNLFFKHFEEMQDTLIAVARLITESIDEMNEQAEESKSTQKIGFCVQKDGGDDNEAKVSAQKS